MFSKTSLLFEGSRPWVRVHFSLTFAISSLFLNAPSVRMASPFSSTSVHRSTGSRAALALLAVMEEVKMEVPKSSLALLRNSGLTVGSAHSLCCHVLLRCFTVGSSVERHLRDLVAAFPPTRSAPLERAFLRDLGMMLSKSKTAEWRAASDLLVLDVENRRDAQPGCSAGCASPRRSLGGRPWHLAPGVRAWVGLKKGIPSDWKRRNRSSLREGTAGCNGGRIVTDPFCR